MKNYILAIAFAASVLAVVGVHAQTPTAPTASPPAPAAPPPGAFQQAGPPSALPDGDGKEIVAVACTQCHGPSVFMQLRMGETAWRNQAYDMVLRGAQVNPDEFNRAVHYLATSFGPGVAFPGPAAPPVTLADGAGKEIVEGGCTLCHGLDRIAAAKRAPDQWKRIVDRMVFFGAPLSDDQQKSVLAYLDAQYAPPQTASK
jgi:cytochrome c5